MPQVRLEGSASATGSVLPSHIISPDNEIDVPRRLTLLAMLLLLAGTTALTGTTGILEGIVRDKSTGASLTGAIVHIQGTRLGTSTDGNGFFIIPNVPTGTVEVRIGSVGYQTIIMGSVQIGPNIKTKIEVELPATLVELDPVLVLAVRPPIQKDVTGTMQIESREVFTRLPVNTISDVISLVPGTTLENNIRGGKSTEVVYLLDGMPVQNLIDGGSGVELPQSAVGELSVQTGGFDPEYGNALSGVINVSTRRATDTWTHSLRVEKDDLFGGQQVDRRTALDLFSSGPITANLMYFGSVELARSDTRWWQDFSRYFGSPIERAYNGFAKVDFLASPSLRLSTQLLYSYKKTHDYEFSWRFNLNGLPARTQSAYRIAVSASDALSSRLTYTTSLSRHNLITAIGDTPRNEVDTTMYQWDFFLRYVVEGSRSWWARNEQITNLAKVDATLLLDNHHTLRFGGEFQFQEIFSDVVRFEPVVNVFGKPFVNKSLLNFSTDFQYFPRSGSAYVQDKLELGKDGMLVNIGFRYEFLDPRAERPRAERVPDPNNQYETRIVEMVPATIKQLLSPRIGFAAPFAEHGYLFINYGTYHQFPLFSYLYSGLNNVSLKRGVGVLIGNPDLKPERTRSWEMSIKYALPSDIVLSATYFNKETTNLIDVKTFVPTNSRVTGNYGFAEFVNNPYARAAGFELAISRTVTPPLTGSVSYTHMSATGLSTDARDGLQFYQWGVPVPGRPFPLSWDQRHSIKVLATLRLPWNVTASAVWNYHSGRPYTYYPSKDGFTPLDTTLTFEPNNSRLDDFSLLNTKLTKVLILGDNRLRINLYVDARNILNRKNIRWVDSSGKPGGELSDLSAWDRGRRISVGLKAEL
jgi:outer membrane receptor protein involved in Fe transport